MYIVQTLFRTATVKALTNVPKNLKICNVTYDKKQALEKQESKKNTRQT